MKMKDRVIGFVMLFNAIFATTHAFYSPDPIIIFIGYFSWSAALVSNDVIPRGWMYIHTGGKRKDFIRDMLLWPVTLVEFSLFTWRVNKANKIIEVGKARGKKLYPEEFEYIAHVQRKTAKWTANLRRIEEEEKCSTD